MAHRTERERLARLEALAVAGGALEPETTIDPRTPRKRIRASMPCARGLARQLEALAAVVRSAGDGVAGRVAWEAPSENTRKALWELEHGVAVFDGAGFNGPDEGLCCPLSPASGPARLAVPAWTDRLEAAAAAMEELDDADGARELRAEARAWRAHGLSDPVAATALAAAVLARLDDRAVDPDRWASSAEHAAATLRTAFALGPGGDGGWAVADLARALGRGHGPTLKRSLDRAGVATWRDRDGRSMVARSDALRALGLDHRAAERLAAAMDAAHGCAAGVPGVRAARAKRTEKSRSDRASGVCR